MKDKERLGERQPDTKGDKGKEQDTPEKKQEPAKQTEKPKDHFEYKGQKYSKDSSYEKLTALAEKLRDKKADRLPVENYQQLRGWIENADRARWAGVLEKQMDLSKQQYGREGAQKTCPIISEYR